MYLQIVKNELVLFYLYHERKITLIYQLFLSLYITGSCLLARRRRLVHIHIMLEPSILSKIPSK